MKRQYFQSFFNQLESTEDVSSIDSQRTLRVSSSYTSLRPSSSSSTTGPISNSHQNLSSSRLNSTSKYQFTKSLPTQKLLLPTSLPEISHIPLTEHDIDFLPNSEMPTVQNSTDSYYTPVSLPEYLKNEVMHREERLAQLQYMNNKYHDAKINEPEDLKNGMHYVMLIVFFF